MNISSIGTNVIPGTLTPIGTVKSTSPHGVAAAASRAILGVQTGRVYKVD